jgi:branched-chain amino acid transport system ATP-binding protein
MTWVSSSVWPTSIAVLVYGEVIAFDTPDAVRANPRVQEAYLGSMLADQQATAAGH